MIVSEIKNKQTNNRMFSACMSRCEKNIRGGLRWESNLQPPDSCDYYIGVISLDEVV